MLATIHVAAAVPTQPAAASSTGEPPAPTSTAVKPKRTLRDGKGKVRWNSMHKNRDAMHNVITDVSGNPVNRDKSVVDKNDDDGDDDDGGGDGDGADDKTGDKGEVRGRP